MQETDYKANKFPTIKVSERARDAIADAQELARRARQPKPKQWDVIDAWLDAYEHSGDSTKESTLTSADLVPKSGCGEYEYLVTLLSAIKRRDAAAAHAIEQLVLAVANLGDITEHGKQPSHSDIAAAKGSRLAKEVRAGVARIDSRAEGNPRRAGTSAEPAGSVSGQAGEKNDPRRAG